MLLKILFLSILVTISAQKTYYDYSLLKIVPLEDDHLAFLKEINLVSNGTHFWKDSSKIGDYASILVAPESRQALEESLSKRSIPYNVMLDDVQQALNDQILGRRKRDASNQLFWTNYQTMEDIYAWFYHLAETHGDIVTVVQAGQTFEGRNITGVRISRGSSRRAIYIDGGQVAADWLSPTVVTYLVDQLVRGDNPEARAASEEFEWHIFPILNPDGHNFTQERDRFWLKNRRVVVQTSGRTIGVDLTKNWNSHWGVSGGSFVANNQDFVGLGPFSEPETRAASRYIESIASRLVGLLSFRAFGQRLIIPFAHTTQPMYNYNDMLTIARRAMGSLSVRYNTQYLVGTSGAVHDGSTGVIADWAKYRFNPPIVVTYQLRDQGAWGYTLPVNQVLPSCEETFDSIMAIIREAKFLNVL